MKTVHFGTFNAERWWRPNDLAELPAVSAGRDAVVATMDEVLVAGCAAGDLLITRRPLSPAVRQALAEAGIAFDHISAVRAHSSDQRNVNELPVERLLTSNRELAAVVGAYDEFRPYAVLPDTVSLLAQWGRRGHLPSAEIVSRVNTKTWSNSLVQKLRLSGYAQVVRSADELSSAVEQCGAIAIVKDPYGVSGSGILRVSGPGVLRAIQRVLRRQEADGRRVELLVQPEMSKRLDFSGHLRIERDGAARILGIQVMTNHSFRHLGSGPASPELLSLLTSQGYQSVLQEVAAALASEGYWGYAGVDSMLLADDTLVPVLEINARTTFGLLALLAGSRVARAGSVCHLWQLGLAVGPDRSVEDVLAALRTADALYRKGARAGVLVLGGGSLSEPTGRLYGLSFCAPGDAASWLDRVAEVLRSAGMRPHVTDNAA